MASGTRRPGPTTCCGSASSRTDWLPGASSGVTSSRLLVTTGRNGWSQSSPPSASVQPSSGWIRPSSARRCHVLHVIGVRVVVAEDQEQIDKVVALETVIYYGPYGLESYRQATSGMLVSGRD
jgi:hypothetical protein